MINNKLNSLRAEREKNEMKIAKLKETNKELDARITELENSNIIGMVREYSLTPDALAELLSAMKEGKAPGKAVMEVDYEN